MSSNVRAAFLTAALAATAADASGFYFGDNGAKALMQGGAFAGQADDVTALQYNPAGLADMSGFNFLVDAQLLNHETAFTRQDNGFDPNNLRLPPETVRNTGGIFFLPFAGVSYGINLGSRRLTIGLGIYGPPSVGRYQYPVPDYDKVTDAMGRMVYENTPRKFAANRYQLINNDVIILYPTLALAFQIHRRFSVGVSLQYVYSSFSFRQSLYADAGLTRPTSQAGEDPAFDSEVSVNLHGKPGFTAIVGAMFRPLDNLSIGASLRPQIPIRADGKLALKLGETATAIGSEVMGDQAELALTLPLELRVGIHFRPISKPVSEMFPLTVGLNLDYVYQGWQSINELVLTPKDVTLKVGSAAAKPVEEFHIPKHWHQSNSIRFGASVDVIKYLTVHAGAWYETGAAPDEQTGIDFLHFDRVFITGGLTAHLWKLDVLAGIAYTPKGTKNVINSAVAAGRDDPTAPPIFVGAGVYESGGWIATFGIRGHFGGAPAAPEPAPVPAPSPVDPVAPPPAAAPAPASAT
jgi:long-chain fatty acid transport protein